MCSINLFGNLIDRGETKWKSKGWRDYKLLALYYYGLKLRRDMGDVNRKKTEQQVLKVVLVSP